MGIVFICDKEICIGSNFMRNSHARGPLLSAKQIIINAENARVLRDNTKRKAKDEDVCFFSSFIYAHVNTSLLT